MFHDGPRRSSGTKRKDMYLRRHRLMQEGKWSSNKRRCCIVKLSGDRNARLQHPSKIISKLRFSGCAAVEGYHVKFDDLAQNRHLMDRTPVVHACASALQPNQLLRNYPLNLFREVSFEGDKKEQKRQTFFALIAPYKRTGSCTSASHKKLGTR